jgi:hypothetical protein
MKEIRNKNNKKVCMADPAAKAVEILLGGALTRIQFMPDGSVQVTNR